MAVILAVSNVIYHKCVEPTYVKSDFSKFAPQFCRVDTPEVLEFVQHLHQELKTSKTTPVQMGLVKALANTAHPEAINVLEPYLTGEVEIHNYVRIEAINALRRAVICHEEVSLFFDEYCYLSNRNFLSYENLFKKNFCSFLFFMRMSI